MSKAYSRIPVIGGPKAKNEAIRRIEKNELACPSCGSPMLHHFSEIENYVREREDEESNPRNPSGRRNGLIIWFACEECGKDNALTIAQHKGCT
jgi:hypothetical protein